MLDELNKKVTIANGKLMFEEYPSEFSEWFTEVPSKLKTTLYHNYPKYSDTITPYYIYSKIWTGVFGW